MVLSQTNVKSLQFHLLARNREEFSSLPYNEPKKLFFKYSLSEPCTTVHIIHFIPINLLAENKCSFPYFTGLITTTARKLDRENQPEHILEVSKNCFCLFFISYLFSCLQKKKPHT